ncbi:DDE-type integrase/transposase/recombinase [Streptomyces sp. NPDC050625]|uniref:DDE-type integrase/transposase/recombinase n=1 Tax=Streptomyces sp. NPDC050625 TaxID=3154629 RepID=UPI0034122845
MRSNFTASVPNRSWVGDITYLAISGGRFLYLATVIDMFSRRLLDWSVADHMRAELVTGALKAALCIRDGRVDGVTFHSDHGAQFEAKAFADACRRAGIRRSMGAVGTSEDTAAAESCFASLKREILPGQHGWPTERAARVPLARLLQPPAQALHDRLPHSGRLRQRERTHLGTAPLPLFPEPGCIPCTRSCPGRPWRSVPRTRP